MAELHKEVLTAKTQERYLKEEMDVCLRNLLETASRLLTDTKYYSQDTGPIVIEWLDLIDQLLISTDGLIKIAFMNEKPQNNVYIERAKNFAEYSILQVIDFCRKALKKKRVSLKNRYTIVKEIRESTLLLLATTFYHIPRILFSTARVLNGKEEPEQILSLGGEAMDHLKHL